MKTIFKSVVLSLLLTCTMAFGQTTIIRSNVTPSNGALFGGISIPIGACYNSSVYVQTVSPFTIYGCTSANAVAGTWASPVGTGGAVSSVNGQVGAVNISTVTIPTGTGFIRITSGSESGTASLINLGADVQGNLPVNNLNSGVNASSTTCWFGDGSWKTCGSGSSGSMVYPSAGISLSTGSAWGTSISAPSGTIVGTTDTQTLTNKTIDGISPATMAFLDATSSIQTQLGTKASLASPTFTGVPLTPTASAGTNTTQVASTAYVTAAVAVEAALARNASSLSSGTVPAGLLPLGSSSAFGAVKCGSGITCTSGVISATGTSGVTTLNTLAGAVVLAAGGNVTLTPSGNTITISASVSGGSGTNPTTTGIPYWNQSTLAWVPSTPALLTAALTDPTKNSAWGFEAGSGGDSSCPTPLAGADYFCYKAGQVQKSHNGGVYAPFMVLTCQPGLGDGLNVIPAGTYPQTTCVNKTGTTWTLNSIACKLDVGSSTCNVVKCLSTDTTTCSAIPLLTGAVTGTFAGAAGTQSSTVTLAPGDWLSGTFVSDGTTKQMVLLVSGTY